MKTWHQRVREAHKRNHQGDGVELIIGPPANPEAITELEREVGRRLPPEFHELYQALDGFGVVTADGELWLFTPLAKIARSAAAAGTWFADSHPSLAKRYFPFIDWGNGDSSGYLFSEEGDLLPGIWIFEHEMYGFDASQPASAFLVKFAKNLQEFLER